MKRGQQRSGLTAAVGILHRDCSCTHLVLWWSRMRTSVRPVGRSMRSESGLWSIVSVNLPGHVAGGPLLWLALPVPSSFRTEAPVLCLLKKGGCGKIGGDPRNSAAPTALAAVRGAEPLVHRHHLTGGGKAPQLSSGSPASGWTGRRRAFFGTHTAADPSTPPPKSVECRVGRVGVLRSPGWTRTAPTPRPASGPPTV